ncbi:MAG: peptidyl-prolyl cis-trans isomerase [Bacteroidetes bacterium]|nr:peptidyl-prolyl cis-trans isomerase [Bacteroidota bacterium]
MRSIISIIALVLFMVQGCSLFVKNDLEEPVARVFENYLYPSDLEKVIPSGTNRQDSMLLAKRYTETWVKDMLMQHRAEESLSEEQMDFQTQIEEYHRSLLIYTYRQNLLQQKMDTLVSEREINSYYEENSKNFVLNQNVIKGTFIKVPLSAPNQDQLRRWSWNNREQDLDQLEKYCLSYAEKYSDFNDTWVDFSSIREQLPRRISNPVRYLNSYRNIEHSDSLFRYLVHISDHLTEGEVAPVEMVSDDITNIILNKRKIKFIKDLEHRVYTDGVSRNQFEIYR